MCTRYLGFALLLGSIVGLGCISDPESEQVTAWSSLDAIQTHLDHRIEGDRLVARLSVQDHIVLLAGGRRSLSNETEASRAFRIYRWDARSDEISTVSDSARGALLTEEALWLARADGELVRVRGAEETVVMEHATGEMADLGDRGIVVVAETPSALESDLFLVRAGREPEALAPAPGFDERPVALPDGRLLFVSTRTTVASLWLIDAGSGEPPIQVTNRGLAAGGPMDGFVPGPSGEVIVSPGKVAYDAGGGDWWSLDLSDLTVHRLNGRPNP